MSGDRVVEDTESCYFLHREKHGVSAVVKRSTYFIAGLTVLFLHTFTMPVLRDIPYFITGKFDFK